MARQRRSAHELVQSIILWFFALYGLACIGIGIMISSLFHL